MTYRDYDTKGVVYNGPVTYGSLWSMGYVCYTNGSRSNANPNLVVRKELSTVTYGAYDTKGMVYIGLVTNWRLCSMGYVTQRDPAVI